MGGGGSLCAAECVVVLSCSVQIELLHSFLLEARSSDSTVTQWTTDCGKKHKAAIKVAVKKLWYTNVL